MIKDTTITLTPTQAFTLRTMLSGALEQFPARHSDPDVQQIVNDTAAILDMLPSEDELDRLIND